MSRNLKNISVVATATVLSRVLGLVREILIAAVFGTSALSSAFVSAFTLPNLYNDQPDYLHKIEVLHDRPSPNPDLIATRLVKAEPSIIPRISIVTPPELDSDG